MKESRNESIREESNENKRASDIMWHGSPWNHWEKQLCTRITFYPRLVLKTGRAAPHKPGFYASAVFRTRIAHEPNRTSIDV